MTHSRFLKSSVTALICLITVSCRGTIPRWEGKIYAGDSATASIQRAQAGEVIKCSAPEFDQMLCMTGSDFKSFYETYVLGCQKWARGMPRMSVREAWAILADAYRHEALYLPTTNQEATEEDEGDGI